MGAARQTTVPIDSDALRANLASTAQEVVIPERYRPLFEAVAGLHGVRAALSEALAEYFHAYRNLDAVIDGLQTTLLRNWAYFERDGRRADLFALLLELVLRLLEDDLDEARFSTLLRAVLMWAEAAVRGGHGPAYAASLAVLREALAQAVPAHTAAFLERDVLLRNLVQRLADWPEEGPAWRELLRQVILAGYRVAAAHLDLPAWALAQGEAGLTRPREVAARFSFLSATGLEDLARRLSAAPAEAVPGPGFPLFSELIERTVDELFRLEDLEDRFAVCLFLLKDETLGYRQKEVMGDLVGVVRELLRPERHVDAERILSRLTAFFRGRDNEFLLQRFQCYEAIGKAIGESGNVKAADHLIEDILYWKFQYPDVQGATDEWQTVVNPYHLPKVRTWMRIVESNPALFERLAAALNVQLRLGGVFIADTDLFQRDVSRFLNADIRPIYFVAKQLLRTFPVYFNEVGAEGELRAVSTEIDEICERRDSLMHFLRKQVHAESSNRLVDFSRAVLEYWRTLDPSGLAPYVSENTLRAVHEERGLAEGPHDVLAALEERWAATRRGGGRRRALPEGEGDLLGWLVRLTPQALAAELEALGPADADGRGGGRRSATDRRRVALVVRTHQLLAEKYSLAAGDVGGHVARHLRLDARLRERFTRALAAWQAHPTPARRDRLLDAALSVLEALKEIILAPGPSQPAENIYQKRHIAAGIPSIYGNYSEPKFDALGLSFRVERLVARLLDDIVDEGVGPYVTRDSLRRMATTIRRFERALRVDGLDSRALSANLALLEASFASHNFTFHQYQNIFQFLANSVAELSSTSILSHDQVMHTMLSHDPRQCEARGMSIDAVAEMVLREVLVSALGLQALDRYLGQAVRQLSTLRGKLSATALTRMMNYDPERLVSPIHRPRAATDDQVTLGFKGLGLKQMASYGHRVPEGFILTTELFDARPAMSHRPLYDDTVARVREALARLERQTGLRLGDPRRPLLLSIRSGAAISMPGLMHTFVNVGLNDRLAEALAAQPGRAWAAWDSYRRFLQSWAMARGVERDFFDNIMLEFKVRYEVDQKLEFSVEQMRQMALTYKRRAIDEGVEFPDDPFTQVLACIEMVLDSWDSPEARLYREYVGIAEEWGTAVVVQRMVFGNLNRRSGSGVTYTTNPLEPHSRQVRLFGDYAVCSQGEDLVGGLVFPLPISEAQRLGSPTYRGTPHSLERDFPEVYAALLAVARDLVAEREFDPQEIEFTFESPHGDDLYILQKRPVVQEQTRDVPVFDTTAPEYGEPVAVGMGVSGGAFAGRVAVNAAQIDRLLAEDPATPIVLLRPDTVPEDIAMIARVQAILTARGGITSHAAVTAKRLGKTAVVECVDLEVLEKVGRARLAGHELGPGDWLSVDGRTGHIFLGRLPVLSRDGGRPGAP